jgi:flagellar basal body-associated protein FliL
VIFCNTAVNGQALATEFSYLIFILLFIVIVLSLIATGICICCKRCGKNAEKKDKQKKRKGLDFSESYIGTSMRDITKSAASSLRRKSKN